ncbi:MAG: hypothetical protein V3U03_15990, partial [Myxococcota bacterium]
MKMREKCLPKGLYRRGTRYWVDVTVAGERVRQPAGDTVEEARAQLARLHGEARVGRTAAGPTVAALIERYLDRQAIRVRPGSLQSARTCCKRLREHLGERRVGTLAVEDLDA